MRRNGFTLVELMIVVSILGILAAIVLPTFQGNTAEAKVSAAKTNLQAMRSQIEMYKMQHNGWAPGYVEGFEVPVATAETQLIGTSTVEGAASTSKTPVAPFNYGPYLQKIPSNPFNGKSNILYSTDFATDAGNLDSGWLYNRETGQICLNYPGTDHESVAYIDY